MATLDESYGFFNAEGEEGSYDRSYDAEQFAQYFALFVGSGVFAYPLNQLQVTSKSGMTVTVRSGWAFIDGYWYHLKQNKDISVPLNQTGETKTHSICCTLDKLNRQITVDILQDVGTGNPRNNDTYHDLVLALINVSGSATQITNSSITDKRPDSNFCGYVTGLVEQIDTTDMFQQLESQFSDWFTGIKEEFGDDPIGGVQSQVDELKKNKVDVTDIVKDYMTNDNQKVLAASVAVLLKGLIDKKQNSITGAASTITANNLNTRMVLVSNANGKVVASNVTSDELYKLHGLTVYVKDQFDAIDKSIQGVKDLLPKSVDTTVKTTANWAVVENAGNYLINASSVRDDAQYYVAGINKRSSEDKYTIIVDQANTAEMTIRLTWQKKQ